jgi:indolepyruvate ferredoxin oxidoreductase beta subunit
MEQYNLVISGLGGQGVMTISHILGRAASREGLGVKLFEGTGITQRGGGVFSFVRFGETYSPKIPYGEADGIICLEMSEIANVIGYLKRQGKVWTSTGRIHGYYTKLRPELYPNQEQIESMIRSRTTHLYLFPAAGLAYEAGSPQAVNMVMLGAFASENGLLTEASIAREIEETNKRFAEANLRAFRKGREFVERSVRGARGGSRSLTDFADNSGNSPRR